MKRVQSYEAPGITVTFDPNVCIHSAVCLRGLPEVFDVRRRRWIRPESATPEAIAAVIDRCPSGALGYSLGTAGEAATPSDEPTAPGARIRASLDGPLLVEGSFVVESEDGSSLPASGRAALCRCGGTRNQPFCDGTHRANGFRSTRSGDPTA